MSTKSGELHSDPTQYWKLIGKLDSYNLLWPDLTYPLLEVLFVSFFTLPIIAIEIHILMALSEI